MKSPRAAEMRLARGTRPAFWLTDHAHAARLETPREIASCRRSTSTSTTMISHAARFAREPTRAAAASHARRCGRVRNGDERRTRVVSYHEPRSRPEAVRRCLERDEVGSHTRQWCAGFSPAVRRIPPNVVKPRAEFPCGRAPCLDHDEAFPPFRVQYSENTRGLVP